MTDVPKKKYRKNFLTQVIYQVTYDQNDLINETNLKLFKGKLGQGYAVLETVKQHGIIIQNDGTEFTTVQQDNSVWQIESTEKDHVIMIGRDNFSITFNKYIDFRRYVGVVTAAHKAFIEVFDGIKQFNRLGLRYVNQIKPEETEFVWSDYINEHLSGAFGFTDENRVRRSMHSMVIEHDEETFITLNYGVYNQFFPSPIVDNQFIIDIDAYTLNSIETGEQSRLLEKFNTAIAIYFEMSIKDKLRNEMEEINE